MQSKRALRIPRVLCHELPKPQKPIPVDSEEAAHLHQVLRLRDGSPVIAMDGRGKAIAARYFIRDRKPWLEATESVPSEQRSAHEEHGKLVLEVAVIKGDAMSWVIEKAVEMGAHRLVPVVSAHAVVQVDKKGGEHFVERWQRIADQALKQCERLHRMQVDAPVTLDELLRRPLSPNAQRLVALEPKARHGMPRPARPMSAALFRSDKTPHILIGPEGGWSQQELELFAAEARASKLESVDLGPLVLRAETAAVFTLGCALSASLEERLGN